MSNILIIRVSAIGDVAMTIPVLYSVAKAHPQDTFTVLTQTSLLPLFIHQPQNVKAIGMDAKTTEKSFFKFIQFILRLRAYNFDRVIDLHSVIRSWIVDFIFRLQGKPVFKINKHRNAGKRFTARPPKKIFQLRSVSDRYADVFKAAGFRFDVQFVSLFDKYPVDETVMKEMAGDKTGRWIGIAPFARHKGKRYPIEKMEKIIEVLSGRNETTLFLFGDRGDERKILHRWENTFCHTVNCSGRFSLEQELLLMSRLDLMVSMDSANMHLASLAGIKVLSIWGATHPFSGFYGYNQRLDLAVQTDLACRPCSIYGDKRCYRNDWACMYSITSEQVVDKINQYLDAL